MPIDSDQSTAEICDSIYEFADIILGNLRLLQLMPFASVSLSPQCDQFHISFYASNALYDRMFNLSQRLRLMSHMRMLNGGPENTSDLLFGLNIRTIQQGCKEFFERGRMPDQESLLPYDQSFVIIDVEVYDLTSHMNGSSRLNAFKEYTELVVVCFPFYCDKMIYLILCKFFFFFSILYQRYEIFDIVLFIK